MRTTEIIHILVSVVTLSYAVAIVRTGLQLPPLGALVEVALTVGAGFILHELAHKRAAQRYHAWAEYRAWTPGLLIALAMAVLLNFVFIAPGAVWIYGPRLTKEQNAKIALAGPMANLGLAILFLVLGWLVPSAEGFAQLGAGVNLFLGWFNLIPLAPFDGQKIYHWNPTYWAAVFGVFTVLAFFVPL